MFATPNAAASSSSKGNAVINSNSSAAARGTFRTPRTPLSQQQQQQQATFRSAVRTSAWHAQSLKKLRRSNYILERILSEQKLKECRLENSCKVLEDSLRRNKRLKLKSTVRNLSANLFLLMACLLLWGNWIMFSPHLDPIVMACLVAVLVSDFQTRVMHWIDTSLRRDRLNGLLAGGLMGTGALWLAAAVGGVTASWPVLQHVSAAACGMLVLAKVTSARTLTAITLTVGVLVSCVLPLALIIKSCAEEMDEANALIFNTLLREDDDGFLARRINAVLVNSAASSIIQVDPAMVSRVQLWIKTHLFAAIVTSQSALGMVANFSNLSWSFGTFAATLFSLLQLDLATTVREHSSSSSAFSPFSAEDNVEIYDTVKAGTWEVFVGSASMGLVNGLVTYGSLWMVGSPLLALPAFASSVLAVLPLFGSYLAVLPFAAGFYLAEMPAQAASIVAAQVVTMLVINPVLLSVSQGGSRFLGGLPIVAGLYAFGLGGIVYGPLIVGLTALTAKIYARAFNSGEEEEEEEGDEDEDDGRGGEDDGNAK